MTDGITVTRFLGIVATSPCTVLHLAGHEVMLTARGSASTSSWRCYWFHCWIFRKTTGSHESPCCSSIGVRLLSGLGAPCYTLWSASRDAVEAPCAPFPWDEANLSAPFGMVVSTISRTLTNYLYGRHYCFAALNSSFAVIVSDRARDSEINKRRYKLKRLSRKSRLYFFTGCAK